jgi:outer membrane receptor protein involved in Fe transport
MTDPGLFTEVVLPSDSFYTTKFGGRVDIVTTDAQAWGDFPDGLRTGTAIGGAPANFPRKDSLYSLYLTEDLQLTDEWTAQASVAHGQRTPSLTERYADGVFLAMMQSGFTRVIGRPDLPRERNFQADLSLKGDFDYWHVRATGFHAWVYDYVTYSSVAVSDPTGALIVFANNTHLATLAGYELYGDLDLSPGISVFATAQWVRGRDQTLDQPLPGIYPLSGRMGLRVVDPYEENRWGTEFGARMVDAQQQLGTIRVVGSNNLRTVETLTPGFTTLYVRGYYNVTPSFNIVAGVDNLLDRNYFEHLNLRLRPDGAFPGVQVLSPGITPYFAVEWKY